MRRGSLGTELLNPELQAALNPPSRHGASVERFGFTFAAGDKVMQVVNDYGKDVYNGDVGFVRTVDPGERELLVEFPGKSTVYPFDDLDELALAYAITIHKSQGSEYPAVVILLANQHHPMLRRNLIYTAVTRARKLVVVIGERRALATAIGQTGGTRRWSRLETWLRENPADGTARSENPQ